MDGTEGYPEAQLPVSQAANRFVQAIWNVGDLGLAWPDADPTLRLCLAQLWLHPNQLRLAADGFSPSDVAAEFTEEVPDHPLWSLFARHQIEHFQRWPYEIGRFETTTAPRVIAPDIELVYFIDTELYGSVIPPGEGPPGVPVLLCYAHKRWRVLNIGSDHVIPEPGWPPTLS